MKKLMLSGALLLCAVTNSTVAQAQWVLVPNSMRIDPSGAASVPNPPYQTGPGYSWSVYGIPQGYTGSDSAVRYNASVSNARGDSEPELVESTLRAGASTNKNWMWQGEGARPTTVSHVHTASVRGDLAVLLPSPRDPGSFPYAKSRVTFVASGCAWPAPETNGVYINLAKFNGASNTSVVYEYVTNEGTGSESGRTGLRSRTIGYTVTGQYTRDNFVNGGGGSVETRIFGYTIADGRGLATTASVFANSSGAITTMSYVLR